MLYDIPVHLQKEKGPKWKEGVGSVPAELPDGTKINIPIYKNVNYLTVGVTGTGKTSSFTEPAAQIILDSDPDIKGVFAALKRGVIDRFMEPDDKVITYDPNMVPASNLFIPNIIREILLASDMEAEMRDIAEFLSAELQDSAGQNQVFVSAAKNTFIAILRVICYCYPDEHTTNWRLINGIKNMPLHEMLAYISRHPANHAFLRMTWGFDPDHPENFQSDRRSSDIMFFFSQMLEMWAGTFLMNGNDTIHDFLKGRYGKKLFLLYDFTASKISRVFFIYYLKKIINHQLSTSANASSPILMMLDEVDKLAEHGHAADFDLFTAATLGRELDLQLICTTQSVESLYALSPDYNEHIVKAGLAGFPVTIAFRPGDASTLSALQHLYGSEYKEEIILPVSRYGLPVIQRDLQPIVTNTDFATLKTGEAYIKIMDHRPQKVRFIKK